jgi:hypothetical protein
MANEIDLERQIFRSSKFRGVVRDGVEFFGNTPVHEFPPAMRFGGAGVYGLYYTGNFTEYARIKEMNADSFVQPIYIGKAVPKGWRTARVTGTQGQTLRGRLRQHARNIVQQAIFLSRISNAGSC